DCAQASARIARRVLPRYQPGQLPGGYFQDGGGEGGLRGRPIRGVREVRLAAPCLCLDEQPLSPGCGDAGGEPGDGDAVAAGDLRQPVQQATGCARAPVSRAVEGELVAGGWAAGFGVVRL